MGFNNKLIRKLKKTPKIKRKPQIICIVGKSGTGKTTLTEKICEEYKDIVSVDSFTTREIRSGEKEKIKQGKQSGHIFLKWKKKVEPVQDLYKQVFELDGKEFKFTKDDIVASTYFNDNHYFTIKEQFEDDFYNKAHKVNKILYVIDEIGLKEFIISMHKREIVVIKLIIDDDELKSRLYKRDSEEKAKSRIQNDVKMFNVLHDKKYFDKNINTKPNKNNDYTKVYKEFKNTILKG